MTTALTFFAVTKIGSKPFELQRLRVTRELQIQLSELFAEQAVDFLGVAVDCVEFTPSYTIQPDDAEVFCVSDFEVPDFLSRLFKGSSTLEDLVPFTEDSPRVKAILGYDPKSQSMYFQYFDGSRILETKRTLIFRKNEFASLDEQAVTVDRRLAATICDGELRFKSFATVRQFLDISILFQEATDEGVSHVLEHSKLMVDDLDSLVPKLSTRVRKRISMLLATKILDEESITPKLIQTRAKRFSGLENLAVKKVGKSWKLIVPQELSKLEKLLRFLCEELYVGELTGRERIANSSRLVTSKA